MASTYLEILKGFVSSKLSLIDTVQLADNLELNFHLHIGGDSNPLALVQIRDQKETSTATHLLDENETNGSPINSDENVAESTETTLASSSFRGRDIPLQLGCHLVVDDAIFLDANKSNFQLGSDSVQFVAIRSETGRGLFMDRSGREFSIRRGPSKSMYFSMTQEAETRKIHVRKSSHFEQFTASKSETVIDDGIWNFQRQNIENCCRIPCRVPTVLSFDYRAVDSAFLISRTRPEDSTTQTWLAVFRHAVTDSRTKEQSDD